MSIEVRLLGPVELRGESGPARPGPAKQRAVLAVLAKYFPGLAAELVIAAAALRSPLSDHPPVPAKEETPDES